MILKILLFGIVCLIIFVPAKLLIQSMQQPITEDIKELQFWAPDLLKVIGTVSIILRYSKTTTPITLLTPGEGNVFEAYLVNKAGPGYQIQDEAADGNLPDTQLTNSSPFTYSQFIITEEPESDPDPNPSDALQEQNTPTILGNNPAIFFL